MDQSSDQTWRAIHIGRLCLPYLCDMLFASKHVLPIPSRFVMAGPSRRLQDSRSIRIKMNVTSGVVRCLESVRPYVVVNSPTKVDYNRIQQVHFRAAGTGASCSFRQIAVANGIPSRP